MNDLYRHVIKINIWEDVRKHRAKKCSVIFTRYKIIFFYLKEIFSAFYDYIYEKYFSLYIYVY